MEVDNEMPIKTHEEAPHWPELFTNPRNFNRQEENQLCLEYIYDFQHPNFDAEEGEDDDEASSEEDSDISGESEDDVKSSGQGDLSEMVAKQGNDSKDSESCDRLSDIRLFMIGYDETLLYSDQVEQVATFCEQRSIDDSGEKTGQVRKVVALLDDSNMCGTLHANKGSFQCTGQCRPHPGPLTAQELCEQLQRKVVQIVSLSRWPEKLTLHSASNSSQPRTLPPASMITVTARKSRSVAFSPHLFRQ
jgi:hypothetical protein